MLTMKILNAGPLSTIQDGGRFGYMSTGFGSGGAMDLRAMEVANVLVGNRPDEGVIEMTMLGITAEFTCDTVIALTGADMRPMLNGEELPMYQAVQVSRGDRLAMGAAQTGMRGYLAVTGGFDIGPVMGSVSTNLKCGIGGFQGRKLAAGDEIPLRYSSDITMLGVVNYPPENDYPNLITVRVVLGLQEDYFTEKGIATFLGARYNVSGQSDRMGVRLEGTPIENKNGVDLISDGSAYGSVQIPASGTPIIMMADRQTTGGYAKIATVITADLCKIAQARPGTGIRFAAVTEKEAVALLRKQKNELKQLQYRMLCSR